MSAALPLAALAKPESAPVYDLLIVGAGTAGIPCAIAAAEAGAKVLVLEKSDRVGGTLHVSGGHLSAGGTKHQAAHGIQDSPEAHFADVMRISKNTAPENLVRLAVDAAPKTVDWLDSLGFEFAPESPRIVYGHVPYTVARTQYGKDAGNSILKALLPSWEKQVEAGTIQVLLNHELTGFLKEKNKIVGVKARNGVVALPFDDGENIMAKTKAPSGGIQEFRARNVVLATGGYAANARFFAEKHPKLSRLISTAAPTSTGEGIALAERAGAQFCNADTHISSLGGIELDPGSGHADFWTAWAQTFTTSYRPAREVYVNARAERFMDETAPDPDYRERAVSGQPGAKFFAIFDETTLNAPGLTLVPKLTPEQIRAEANRGKFFWVADSLENLARKTNLNPAVLTKTMAEFNASKRGYTVETGPFYALLTYATALISFGGLKVNDQLQVLDRRDQPIPGLYAAGEVLGAGATTGNAFCGGMLVTPAISFGRILGQRLGMSKGVREQMSK